MDERCCVGSGFRPLSLHQPLEGDGGAPGLDLPWYHRAEHMVVHGETQGPDVGLKPMVVLEPKALAGHTSPPPTRYAIVRVLMREKSSVTLWLAHPLVTAFPSLAFPHAPHTSGAPLQPTLCGPPGQLVVIKASRKGLEGDDPYMEIRALRRLAPREGGRVDAAAAQAGGTKTHESTQDGHVVRLLDAFQDEGHVYSVLPYMSGQDLCAFLMHRKGGLPEHQARVVMQQVVIALLELQKHGLAHGDVSLENLMATPLVDGERVHVTLLDLGMAKDLRPYVSPPVLRGKPPYLAPEAVLGHSPLDPGALDVWALGVVLYILLTSCPLYSTPDHPAFAMLCPQPTGSRVEELVDHYVTLGLKRPSDGAMDLLCRLLHPCPDERASLQEIARHPWMTNAPLAACTGGCEKQGCGRWQAEGRSGRGMEMQLNCN